MSARLGRREREVLAACVKAGSQAEAAQSLGMPLATLKAHLRNMRSKERGATLLQLVRIHSEELPLPFGIVQKDE